MLTSAIASARAGYRWLRKRAKRALSHLWLVALKIRNRCARKSILGTADVFVSLTTFGHRLNTVAYTIESISAGSIRPTRIVLWLDDPRAYEQLPSSLRRLQRRGLEIRLTENLGPHTKYFPILDSAIEAGVPVVTADDDILYPRSWLAGLVSAAGEFPTTINCYRASIVALRRGDVAPYDEWPRCTDAMPSPTCFGTGVSGVIYPVLMLQHLQGRGTAFVDSCLKADDIWLHWVALHAGIPVRQIDARPRHFPLVPGTQEQSLMATNVALRRNDDYVASLYGPAEVAALAAAGAPSLA